MEVLISCFVLSMGLLGVAALLPLGRLAINETSKADRAGACGRAAMREIKIRHILDGLNSPNPQFMWLSYGTAGYGTFTNPTGGAFIVNPLGIANWAVNSGAIGGAFATTPPTGGTLHVVVPFVTPLYLAPTGGGAAATPAAAAASQVFAWHDDLTFTNPEDMTLSGTASLAQSSRPLDTGLRVSGAAAGPNAGNYSWFLTVTPSLSELISPISYDPKHYNVSVVVCYGRDFTTNGGALNGMKEAYVYTGPLAPMGGGTAGSAMGFAPARRSAMSGSTRMGRRPARPTRRQP